MKAILALIIIVFFGTFAVAQDGPVASEDTRSTDITVTKENVAPEQNFKEVPQGTDELVRLYRFKNSRVLKELAFTTKRNNAKLA